MRKRDFITENFGKLLLLTFWVLFWLTVNAWTYTDDFRQRVQP